MAPRTRSNVVKTVLATPKDPEVLGTRLGSDTKVYRVRRPETPLVGSPSNLTRSRGGHSLGVTSDPGALDLVHPRRSLVSRLDLFEVGPILRGDGCVGEGLRPRQS